MTAEVRNLFVGTPTLNGTAMSDYVVSLMGMAGRLREAGIPMRYRLVDGPHAMVQRDLLAADFLASDCSHLLLVDPDIAFGPDLATRLLAAGRAVAGAVCQRRTPDLLRAAGLATRHGLDRALALDCDWEVRLLDGKATVEDGWCRVAALGTGVLLVARECLERLAASPDAPPYREGGRRLVAFFRETLNGGAVADPQDAFFRRWRRAGGEVWADVEADVRRVTDAAFGLPFRSYLEAHRRLAEAAPAPAGFVAPGPRS